MIGYVSQRMRLAFCSQFHCHKIKSAVYYETDLYFFFADDATFKDKLCNTMEDSIFVNRNYVYIYKNMRVCP